MSVVSDFLDRCFPGRVYKREARAAYYAAECPYGGEHTPEEWYAAHPAVGTFSGFACSKCGEEAP